MGGTQDILIRALCLNVWCQIVHISQSDVEDEMIIVCCTRLHHGLLPRTQTPPSSSPPKYTHRVEEHKELHHQRRTEQN
jgi:hypothetical protein